MFFELFRVFSGVLLAESPQKSAPLGRLPRQELPPTTDGAAAFSDSLEAMRGSAGATETAFETMNKGFSADMEKIRANLKVLSIEIGSRLAPFVAKATSAILKGFQKLSPTLKTLRERACKEGKNHSC